MRKAFSLVAPVGVSAERADKRRGRRALAHTNSHKLVHDLYMIILLLLPSLTAVAEAMSSDPLRVCALSPSPRGSVSFTCMNLSVCTQRRRFFDGQEPSIVDVKHTTQPRENNKSKFDRGIIWCAPRTFRGACGEASPSPRNVGNFRLQAKPVSAARTCNKRVPDKVKSGSTQHCRLYLQ